LVQTGLDSLISRIPLGAALAVAAVIALAPGGLAESDQIAFSLVHGESGSM
jgi:hypothetical protein